MLCSMLSTGLVFIFWNISTSFLFGVVTNFLEIFMKVAIEEIFIKSSSQPIPIVTHIMSNTQIKISFYDIRR